MADGYEIEVTVRDAKGRKFGGKAEGVSAEKFNRLMDEMGHSVKQFVSGTTDFDRNARGRLDFTLVGDDAVNLGAP